ncbi:MAG: hypothetical protein CML22_07400 [Rheinheimera sp.]|nr:hypothetical protein [Rheinheimera sp.]MBM34109.1 hypothetical protein [Rheinheimera sp.]|tara:strand:+ start:21917 stop:22810 length:894 start_codon:yes stop_codon:yes gene_type:complete
MSDVAEVEVPVEEPKSVQPAAKPQTINTKAKAEKPKAAPSAAVDEPLSDGVKEDKASASKTEKPAPSRKNNKQRSSRPSRDEIIRQQSNPATRLAGRQKTITLPFQYTSDIMHEYILLNQSKMLDAYERLAALLRMLVNAPELHNDVKGWITKNTQIADAQLNELTSQRLAILEQSGDIEFPEIKIPDSYHTQFEASHPIANMMIATLRRVDTELNECEKLYMALLIDDVEYRRLFNQATNVIRGSVDRIFKATNPGRRKENGRYSPGQLAAWIREGNKLIFADVPQSLTYLIEEAA